MSETYTYGEVGKKGSRERIEYNALSEPDFHEYIEMVSDILESFFARAQPSEHVFTEYFKEGNITTHNLGFLYYSRNNEGDTETTLLYDTQHDTIAEYTPPVIPVINSIVIKHEAHSKGNLKEEYSFKFDQTLYETKGAFSNRYYFKRYVGSHWQAWVEHNNIDPEPQSDGSEYYTRPMTEYDFIDFFKDTTEINAHLQALLVQ